MDTLLIDLVLMELGSSEYSIVNTREPSLVIIEDDDLAEAIEQEMLKHDMPILDPEDFETEGA